MSRLRLAFRLFFQALSGKIDATRAESLTATQATLKKTTEDRKERRAWVVQQLQLLQQLRTTIAATQGADTGAAASTTPSAGVGTGPSQRRPLVAS